MRKFALTFLLLLCFVVSANAAPNIVVIITDDQEDMGSMAYMRKLHSLAEQGVTFTNSFVDFSLCAPSRSSFLTGEAAHNHGVESNKAEWGGGWSAFRRTEPNDLAVWLQKAGYKTALIGKYLNGYARGKPPRQKGREYFASTVSRWLGASDSGLPRVLVPPGWDLWYAFKKIAYYDYSINEDGKFADFGHGSADYSTDVLKNRAVGFIKDQASSTTPFFMLITPRAPHSAGGAMDGAIPSPTYAEAFANAKLPLPSAFNEVDVSDKPPMVANKPLLDDAAKSQIEKSYRAELQSLQSVDDLVGAVMDELRATGKLDNTLIIYTSDNGFEYGDHRLVGKNSFYEASIKVPLIVKGPGIPQNEMRSQLVNNLDVVATIEEVAGLSPSIAPDGHSLTPVLLDSKAPWRSAILIEGGNDASGVRAATKKYVHYEDGFEELYDLTVDPYELENKIHDPGYASDVATLRGLRERLKSCTGSGCWVP